VLTVVGGCWLNREFRAAHDAGHRLRSYASSVCAGRNVVAWSWAATSQSRQGKLTSHRGAARRTPRHAVTHLVDGDTPVVPLAVALACEAVLLGGGGAVSQQPASTNQATRPANSAAPGAGTHLATLGVHHRAVVVVEAWGEGDLGVRRRLRRQQERSRHLTGCSLRAGCTPTCSKWPGHRRDHRRPLSRRVRYVPGTQRGGQRCQFLSPRPQGAAQAGCGPGHAPGLPRRLARPDPGP
jgi:hypothetical protein